ncbi:hypothetical protein [Chitinophaga japonensis]|uniref:Uncharacterized protein n=1 Tax=Chitinophaga japonensis TaxID=104662 RepID=A0A562T562_CHIJA|nr:hypothetical protein [Chitinophaga japonensis]TWI88642.1 hypothetical protein LX66_2728 [Chitinophaga japonensis]
MQSRQPTGHIEQPLQLTGRLELRTFYANTKRSYAGVCLVTEKEEYLIRPADVPATQENPLQSLLGKNVTVKGRLQNEVFLMEELLIIHY